MMTLTLGEIGLPACPKHGVFCMDATQALSFDDVEGPHYRSSRDLSLCDTTEATGTG